MKSTTTIQGTLDLIVVGAGIFGLWAARHAMLRGERVMVLEKRNVGAGASGGFLGSLMPHMPDTWNAKKQMQFEGLATIGEAVARLEEDTGLDCGFRRCGRLMPMLHEKMIEHAKARIAGAATNWKHGSASFSMDYLKPGFKGTIAEGWLSEGGAPFGATYDTLSARVNPRNYLQALAAYIRSESHGRGEIVEGAEVLAVSGNGDGAQVRLADGTKLSAGRVIIANGWEAYALLAGAGAHVSGQPVTGRGVKGQAVLLERSHDDNQPIIYDNGSYIVPHGTCMGSDAKGRANRIAVGSTSVNDWRPAGLADMPRFIGHRKTPQAPETADHPEWPASVEPAVNRTGYDDGPLPQFTEMAGLSDRVQSRKLAMPSESFAGELTPDDPLAAKLVEAARTSFDHGDTRFLDHAKALCPSLQDAPIAERWANIRPRNTIPDPETGKTGTEPVFAALDENKHILVAIGGYKISFGIGHLEKLHKR